MQSLNSLLSGILTKSLRRLVAAPPRLKSRRSSKSNPSSDRHGGGSAAVAFAVGSVGGITCGVFLAEHDLLPERLSFSKTTPSSSLILDDSSAARVLGGEAPSQSYRRVSESFVSEFDTSTRNPRWVVEQLHAKDKISHRNNSSSEASTTSSAAVAVSREGHTFREDDSLLVHHRSRPAHYKGSGLDRGHLAPAADMISDEGMSDSFRLSNVSPQVGKGFNRGYWARLEKFVRDLPNKSKEEGRSVYVCTGPLYVPTLVKTSKAHHSPPYQWEYRHRALGSPPQWLAVPTHFFKVIVVVDSHKVATAAAAFVLPNQSIDPLTPLSQFAVPLTTVEAVSGLNLFPSLLSCDDKALLDKGGGDGTSSNGSIKNKKKGSTLPLALNAAKVLAPELCSALQANQSTGRQSNADAGKLLLESAPFWESQSPNAVVVAETAIINVTTSKGLRASRGLKHLCEVTDCRLPKEAWFEAKNGKKNITQ